MSILCYHAVDPHWSSPISIDPADFEAQCAWLARRRRVLPLADAVSRLDPKGRLPRGTASITFDDGFASLFHHAVPALGRHALPATVFLVAETLLPEGRAVDWVDDPPPGGLLTLALDQILEMQGMGLRFGSHSNRHADLPSLTDDECLRDLRASRELLEDLLGRPVPFVAYPRGAHDERVRRAAHRAGFTHGFSLPETKERAGPFAIPRVGVYPGNGTRGLSAKTSPWYLSVRTSAAYPFLRSIARRGRAPARPPG